MSDRQHPISALKIRLTPGISKKLQRDALPRHERPCVLLSPWEHHSNILSQCVIVTDTSTCFKVDTRSMTVSPVWHEASARIIEIPADPQTGAFSYENLVSTLKSLCQQPRHPLLIGSFSAASNITGITLHMKRVARIMHRYGGIVAFDCAAWASHLPVNMNPVEDGPEASADAIFLSPHKLPGGPG